jgi:hypothetical protein
VELYGVDSPGRDTENEVKSGLLPNPGALRGVDDASNCFSIIVSGHPDNRRGWISCYVGYSSAFINH